MTLKTIITVVLAGAAVLLGAQAASAGPTPDAMREDGFDRAVAQARFQQWMAEDGFDRAVAAAETLRSAPRLAPDTYELLMSSMRGYDVSPRYSDSVDGSIAARTQQPVVADSPSSGREIAWHQIGIGFAVGILLAFGLYLGRLTRARALAH